MLENIPIYTQLGIINGRDGIYLDKMHQDLNQLTFIGDINGKLCTNNELGYRWYSYKLVFNHVQAYDCRGLDICRWKVVSSLDEVKNSDVLKEVKLDGKGYNHYILSTYDYIYSIIAKGFEMEITEGR
ncbi:hypothetical protein ABD76_27830 [Paenibacillus dendritiformis]|uniref:hypothetical protein n=1 Tax=Paenibacillus dendritiformis TaxID=130049 RepID=UPI0018CEE90C|nr:hypothetical protein [Paenibacillus dendritiformis]MBG9796038.1 hypothetical protein [Paenibacillus dendritiformis]